MVRFTRVLITAIAVLAAVAACAGPPQAIIGVDGPTVSALALNENTLVDVFVATSRAPDDDPRILFGDDRSETVGFAKVTVSIPPNHEVGKIERPTGAAPDPRTEFAIVAPRMIPSSDAFISAVNAELVERQARNRDVLVFVHGYNTDLTSAILRTAQFAHDVGFDGVPVVFSWASAGTTQKYVYDLNSALHARDSLLHAGSILSQTDANGFDVVAHSMGTILVVEAMRQHALMHNGSLPQNFRVKTLTLAAPDIDLDLFRRQISFLPKNQIPIYVMISADDRALALSRAIAGGVPRVGAADARELEDLGLIVVDLSNVATDERIGHTKFANSPKVVGIIGRGLQAGNRLTTHTDGGFRLQTLLDAPGQLLDGAQQLVVE